jgi:choline dehydrogenase-like flavoprotein
VPRSERTAFDFAVVGAGSSGCIVAARLAEGGASVLLLEAGDRAEVHAETLRADGYKHAFVNDRLMWDRFSEPQPGCAGRRLWLGSGRGVGGSGAVNGMVYTRGCVQDYEDWPVGWRWSDLAGDFAAVEARLRPRRRPPTEFTEACLAASELAGFRHLEDLNRGDLAGAIGYEWMNYEGEARRSSYAAWLREPESAARVELECGAHVTRLLIRAGRAVGLEYRIGGELRRVDISGEVVLCAGALATPCILLATGIGPPDALRRLGIQVELEAPLVGENLHDHPNVAMFHLARRPVDCYYPQLYGFHRANPALPLAADQPDTCYVMYPAPSSFHQALQRMVPTLILPPRLHRVAAARRVLRRGIDLALAPSASRWLVDHLYALVVILGKPCSRGRITLASSDPATPPRIDPGYFTNPADLETMLRAVELARAIAGQEPLRRFGNRELTPGRRARSSEAVGRWIARNAMTTFHYAGSCRMGAEAVAPVDTALRLRGIEGVRVADASIMPTAPVAALNAATMAIGWRAADYLLGARSELSQRDSMPVLQAAASLSP